MNDDLNTIPIPWQLKKYDNELFMTLDTNEFYKIIIHLWSNLRQHESDHHQTASKLIVTAAVAAVAARAIQADVDVPPATLARSSSLISSLF